MNVLKDNYNGYGKVIGKNPYPRKAICERCRSELEYDESDIRVGVYGCAFIDCPLCRHETILDGNENAITLTMDNVEFPVHFNHTSTETGAVDCFNNETIKEYVRKAVAYLRKYKDETHYGGHISGNFYIDVTKWSGDEDYEVVVSNDFYHTIIPFEREDYDD